MTIVEIYNSIIKKEPETEKVDRSWKPIEALDYGNIPEFKVPQKREKVSLNKMLASSLLFVDLVKHKRLKDIPLCEKYCLTIAEASAYFGICEKKLRNVIDSQRDAKWLIQNGVKYLIKRKLFEEFLDQISSI